MEVFEDSRGTAEIERNSRVLKNIMVVDQDVESWHKQKPTSVMRLGM
jgi:hypothetical protein